MNPSLTYKLILDQWSMQRITVTIDFADASGVED